MKKRLSLKKRIILSTLGLVLGGALISVLHAPRMSTSQSPSAASRTSISPLAQPTSRLTAGEYLERRGQRATGGAQPASEQSEYGDLSEPQDVLAFSELITLSAEEQRLLAQSLLEEPELTDSERIAKLFGEERAREYEAAQDRLYTEGEGQWRREQAQAIATKIGIDGAKLTEVEQVLERATQQFPLYSQESKELERQLPKLTDAERERVVDELAQKSQRAERNRLRFLQQQLGTLLTDEQLNQVFSLPEFQRPIDVDEPIEEASPSRDEEIELSTDDAS